MKNSLLLLAMFAISFLVLFGQSAKAQAEKQEEIRVVGVIESYNADTHQIRLKDDRGAIHDLTLDKASVVMSGDRKVSQATIKPGLKAVVKYRVVKSREEAGKPGPEPGLTIAYVLKQIVNRIELASSAESVASGEERFVDNGDGTVTDTKTNLMWQKNDNGKEVTFAEAQQYCKNLRLGGYTDWRLPKTDEKDIGVVVELMMPRHSTKGLQDFYWSADPTELLSFNYPAPDIVVSNAYGVEEGAKAFVRAVRSLIAPRSKER